jgi:hypothetical protein
MRPAIYRSFRKFHQVVELCEIFRKTCLYGRSDGVVVHAPSRPGNSFSSIGSKLALMVKMINDWATMALA